MVLKVEIEDDKEYEGLLSNMKRQRETTEKCSRKKRLLEGCEKEENSLFVSPYL